MRGLQPDDLYRIHWLGECDITPDGSRVAFVVATMDREADEYRSAIWVVDTEGESQPRQFTASLKRDTAPRWSPDGRWLAFLSERGEEKPQLFVMPADGGEGRALTKLPSGAHVPVWAPDSQRLAFAARTGIPPDPSSKKAKPYRRIDSLKHRINGAGWTYDRRRHVFVVDMAGGEVRQVTDGPWDDSQPAWSPDDARLAFVSARHADRDYDSHSDIFVVAAEGGEATCITETNGACGAPAWSPDGLTIAHLYTPDWPANATLRLVGARGGDIRPVDPEFDRTTGAGALPGAVAQPAWLAGGGILSVGQDRGVVAPIIALEGKATRWVGREAGRSAAWYSVARVGRTAAITFGSVTCPPELSLVDLERGDERALTNFNMPWMHEAHPAPVERLVVKTAEGVEVDCWLMKPAQFEEGKKYPVLLNIHGGPFGQYGDTFFDEFQVYSGAGYGVVFCNPRGSSGQATPFARALVERMGEPDYEDVMAAFEAALARMPWADQSRLGVMGGSYGGFMTSWIVGHSNRFAAAVSERAVNDWYSMQGASDIGATFNRHYLGERANTFEDLESLLRQSPLHFAHQIETPLLILHAEDDLRCPISQAEQLFVILKLRRKDVEFVRFPDENHEMSRSGRPSHRVDRFNVILDYFGRKLAAGA